MNCHYGLQSGCNVIFLVISGEYKVKDAGLSNNEHDPGNCTQDMFPIKTSNSQTVMRFDKAAYLSCQTQYALQRNWYPDPIEGLFTYQTWNGMDGFWQNGVAVEAMVNAMTYGNHSRYISVVKVAFK